MTKDTKELLAGVIIIAAIYAVLMVIYCTESRKELLDHCKREGCAFNDY